MQLNLWQMYEVEGDMSGMDPDFSIPLPRKIRVTKRQNTVSASKRRHRIQPKTRFRNPRVNPPLRKNINNRSTFEQSVRENVRQVKPFSVIWIPGGFRLGPRGKNKSFSCQSTRAENLPCTAGVDVTDLKTLEHFHALCNTSNPLRRKRFEWNSWKFPKWNTEKKRVEEWN